jgi:hypothetical protein
MTISMTISTHDIRLVTRAGNHLGSCSCGWESAEDPIRSVAATAAVHHSTTCAGDAVMGSYDEAVIYGVKQSA